MIRLACFCCFVASFFASAVVISGGAYPSGSTTQTFARPDGTTDLGDGSIVGADQIAADGNPLAAIYGGLLRLAHGGTTNGVASFKLPDLDAGNVVKSFDIRWTVTMNSTNQTPAGEGWSMNFGDIPEDNGTGEEGFAPLRNGLTLAFDTRDNGDDPTSIEVFVGGVSITNLPMNFFFGSAARSVVVHWDSFGLDLSFDNKVMFADLATPGFSPGVGNRFAFTARTSEATMDIFIDNLKATTQALPVLDTGGPIISEFVADNGEFEDEFAEKPSWIELFNGSPVSVDLTGWYLTDSKKNLTKWRIDGLTLTPYNYQIVFASGLDRQATPLSSPQANFSLSNDGEYLALVRPDGTIASSYEFGPQQENVSYGEQGTNRTRGFMYPASPGTVNSQVPALFSLGPAVQFSHSGGFVTGPVTVSLSVPNATGRQIRYTLDRTEPGTNSLLYTSAIEVNQVVTIKARSFTPEHLPGPVSSRTFLPVDQTLTNYAESGKMFDSNLPLIYLESFGVSVDSSGGGSAPFRPSYAVVIAPDASTGRASLTNAPQYAGPAGVHVRGESSAGFQQKSYALELWNERNQDFDASLLGMPAESDWVLYGPWSEKSLMRNKLIFDWMLALRGEDGTAMRTRFVELFFNQSRSTTRVGFNTYRGVYVLMEKIKRDNQRVPLENLNQKTIDPDLITGGYIIRKDKPDSAKNTWNSRFVDFQSFDPDRFNTNQLNYIKGYIAAFETALTGANSRSFETGYQAYIEPDTFIDAQWMLEFAKQVDGYVFSTYWHKDRGGRLRAGPLWDFNISLGNASYAGGDSPTGWYAGGPAGQLWYPRLHTDPEYKLAHWDRYWHMRRTIWDTNAIMAKIDENARLLLDGYQGLISNRAPASIQNPVARHYRKWPRLGTVDWPNPSIESSIRTWQGEIDYLKNFIRTRVNWLDDQSLRSGRNVFRPPVFSHSGGEISQPFLLELSPYRRSDPSVTFPDGIIYYTMDNSDPRLPGGTTNPYAVRYSERIPILSSVSISARLYAQGQWSPLTTASFLLDAEPANSSNLVVSEIMYQPADLTALETNALLSDSRTFEFVELRNISRKTIDMAGVKFTSGIEFDFAFGTPASRLLKPGESIVLVSDRRAFALRYPHVSSAKVVGQFRGQFNSGGETVSLLAADGSVIDQFEYDNGSPWPNSSVPGRSLILKEPATNPNPDEPSSWALSARQGGTPAESGLGASVFSGDPLNDTDADGLQDLFEFAFGSDPENPGSANFPEIRLSPATVNGAVDEYVQVAFRRKPDITGLQLLLESSTDLSQWSPNISNLVPLSTVTNQDGTISERFRSVTPAAGNGRTSFYRVRVRQE